jgi:hypothetical protein
MMNIKWRFILSKGWKITLTGLLIAVGIVLFPQAQCAVAQTCDGPRDKWCGSGKCCDPAAGFLAVTGCSYNSSTGFCEEKTTTVKVRCSNSSNCEVTDVLGSPNRLSGGYWSVGKCEWNGCYLNPNANSVRVTCCTGSGGGGCTPRYAPPTIDDSYTVDPPNPIVWTQEQPPYGQALGMTINDIKAHGGADTACGSGRANITSLDVQVNLRQESIDWILNDLGRRYIGVRIKDIYPKFPERPDDPFHPYANCAWTFGTTGINTPDAELDCRFFKPLDPGQYDVTVTACQSDGQCVTKTMSRPIDVWLLETRLEWP